MPKIFSELSPCCKRITLHGPTMGTRWSASLDAHARLDLAALREGLAKAVQLVDQQMSPWKHDSGLMRLNRAPVDTWVDLPAELLEVLTCALDIHRLSAGAFDPGVGALVDAWGFGAVRDPRCAPGRVPQHSGTDVGSAQRTRSQKRAAAARPVRDCQRLCGGSHGCGTTTARG